LSQLPDVTQLDDEPYHGYHLKRNKSEFDTEIEIVDKCPQCGEYITNIDKPIDGYCSVDCAEESEKERDE